MISNAPQTLNSLASAEQTACGVLLSGGLDSSILTGHLLNRGFDVQPFYVRSCLRWEPFELSAVQRFLSQIARPGLRPLVVLDLPVGDLYADHWSITGQNVPDAQSPDEAVYLPGRNALLILKASLWCQLHGIERLALAPLAANPFADARQEFFEHLQAALNQSAPGRVSIERPFAAFSKQEVMRLGSKLPLSSTFSCISPAGVQHCGRCNKCAERQAAFRSVGRRDETTYAADLAFPSNASGQDMR